MPESQLVEPENEQSGLILSAHFPAHRNSVWALAFEPNGRRLAAVSEDGELAAWDLRSEAQTTQLRSRKSNISLTHRWSANALRVNGADGIRDLAFHPTKPLVVLACRTGIALWDLQKNKISIIDDEPARSLRIHPTLGIVAIAYYRGPVGLWSFGSARNLSRISTAREIPGEMHRIAFHPLKPLLALTGSNEGDLFLKNVTTGHSQKFGIAFENLMSIALHPYLPMLVVGHRSELTIVSTETMKISERLEGHTGIVDEVSFSHDGRLLASKSNDDTIRLWHTANWGLAARISARKERETQERRPALAFHPTRSVLAAAIHGGPAHTNGRYIATWKIDIDLLVSTNIQASQAAVHHTTGKVVLLGDHSVGKSALGYRLINGHFREQASTHGQQFWLFPSLGRRRKDATECEAILWDFAGQPDYRLVHALFVDNADLALVLFDASDLRDPLHGVTFWLKQLGSGASRCPIILVAAQSDRGTCPLSEDDLRAFCRSHGIDLPIVTSAFTGEGIDSLLARMQALIAWDDKPATITTVTFKKIKDYVLGLKEEDLGGRLIVTVEELRSRLQGTDEGSIFSDAEILTAVGHLENYGYVRRLRTSNGEHRILLEPERLNNLASSFVLAARRNHKGLGALEEKRLLSGRYEFPELLGLKAGESELLVDAAALLFLEHNVCLRETDPLRKETYLVFPELINLKPLRAVETAPTEDGATYTATGATENVFASLVVLLGYTHTFSRTAQWQNNARYEVGDGHVCGFRQESQRDGEIDFVLCFGHSVGTPVRTLFQGLFESFLARRNLTVMRYEPVRCIDSTCGQLLERSIVRTRLQKGARHAHCSNCGGRLLLPHVSEPIQLTRAVQAEVSAQRRTAELRTRFEQAVFRVRAHVVERKILTPSCFVSYAWGDVENERWVEKRLATDLQNAGFDIVLDRWHNAQIGASVARFIERIQSIDRVIVVGTPDYKRKYENLESDKGYIVAAEVDLINNRLLGTELQKSSILPLVKTGEKSSSLPPLMHSRVHANYTNDEHYFLVTFEVILSLYGITPHDPAVVDLRDSLANSL